MPVPTSYSEAIFADYLVSVLGSVADMLSWDAGSVQVQEAVADALLDLGSSSIASVTSSSDIRGLRALGRRAIWRAVVQATAGRYSFSSDGQRFDRHQINEQAHKAMALADHECRMVGVDPDYAVSIVSVVRPHDPYQVLPDEARIP